MEKHHILIIEDDASIREGVRILLEGEGYCVAEASNGHDGLKHIKNNPSQKDLVILDIMMPGISGIKTCEEIRKLSNVPILFLTARAQESDKLIGLMAGGDDYLVKPFSYAELLARVKALLRRYRIYDSKEPVCERLPKWVEAGGLRLHTERHEIWLNGQEISLTDIEHRLLLLMMQNPQKIFSLKKLYEAVWEEPFLYTSGNTVMVHIRRLRKKIEENPQKPQIIQTVWGKGYRFG